MSTAEAGAPRAGRREWIGLGVIALPCLLYSMDLTVLNLAVPRLSAALRPSSAQLLWIVDIYGFVLAGCLIPMGTLGDRIGRRKLLLIGAAAFGVASIFAAFATSAAVLIVARAVLGVAGATLAPSTLSLIRNMFLDANERTSAIGVWVTSYSVGGAIGPLVGGVLLDHFWWGSVFLVGVPVMVLLLVVGPMLLPEFRDPKAGRIDLPSTVMSLGAVLFVIYGVKRIAVMNTYQWPLIFIGIGLGLGVLFVRRQRTLEDPMIELALFRNPAFSAALLSYTIATFAAFGIYLLVGQYLQLVIGLSPLAAGVATLPLFFGFIAGALVSPVVARRVRPARLMIGGLVFSAIGFGLLTRVDAPSPLFMIVSGITIYALGLSPVFTLATDFMVGAASPERAGAASALSETGSELGGALGVGILGSIGTAVYRSAMLRAVPTGLSSTVVDAARNTLGGALDVASRLPANSGLALSAVARNAFAQSLAVTAWACVVVVIATAMALGIASRR